MRYNNAKIIKDKITMPELLRRYGITPHRRMGCPIHGGKDKNFEVKERSFMCYSHCGGGDVITFVQKYFSLSFQEAIKKIDEDFNLCLFGKISRQKALFNAKNDFMHRKEKERIEAKKKLLESTYWHEFEEWKRLDENKRKYAPKSLDEEWNPLFVEALQKLEYQKYKLEIAEVMRHEPIS